MHTDAQRQWQRKNTNGPTNIYFVFGKHDKTHMYHPHHRHPLRADVNGKWTSARRTHTFFLHNFEFIVRVHRVRRVRACERRKNGDLIEFLFSFSSHLCVCVWVGAIAPLCLRRSRLYYFFFLAQRHFSSFVRLVHHSQSHNLSSSSSTTSLPCPVCFVCCSLASAFSFSFNFISFLSSLAPIHTIGHLSRCSSVPFFKLGVLRRHGTKRMKMNGKRRINTQNPSKERKRNGWWSEAERRKEKKQTRREREITGAAIATDSFVEQQTQRVLHCNSLWHRLRLRENEIANENNDEPATLY